MSALRPTVIPRRPEAFDEAEEEGEQWDSTFKNDPNAQTKWAALKLGRGCDGPLPHGRAHIIPDLPMVQTTRCPWSEPFESAWWALREFEEWDAVGTIPLGEAQIDDVPAILVQAFALLATLKEAGRLAQDLEVRAAQTKALMGSSRRA